jgi:CelD/BcsL family acetyltransferase involved in cellulose biosynthesis
MATAQQSTAAHYSLAETLDLGPSAWDELLCRAGITSPFVSWAWHQAWREGLRNGGEASEVAAAQVVALRSGSGRLEALFPFRVSRMRFRRVPVYALSWAIGDVGCPDHLELLATPEADLDALVGAVADVSWDVIVLNNVAEAASNVDRFCEACERRRWTVRRSPLWPCPYLELPDSWDAYLSRLSRHRREAVRRRERRLCREHRVSVSDYGGARFLEGWRHLTRLHSARWGRAGVLREGWAAERLQRSFASLLDERGQLWLTTLDVDGAPVAAWYGFVAADTVYYYQGGWDPGWAHCEVGSILLGAMIRRAIERRHRVFDFLRGAERYKAYWTRTSRLCYEIVVTRPSMRGAVLRGLDWVARHRVRRWLQGVAGTAQRVGERTDRE